MIRFVCPAPGCGSVFEFADEYAGIRAQCRKCHVWTIIPDGTIQEVHLGKPLPQEPPRIQTNSPKDYNWGNLENGDPDEESRELSHERCYDCGRRIHEGEIKRKDIAVGESAGSGGGQPVSYVHWSRVSLCRRCSYRRDERIRAHDRAFGMCLLVFLGLIVLMALVYFATGGRF